MGDLLREGDDDESTTLLIKEVWLDVCSSSHLILSVVGRGEGDDKDFPDLPKNWGFMTLRRTKKK